MGRVLRFRKDGEQFRQAGYTADILQSRGEDRFWYYVIQPTGSREIVAIERRDSYTEAREAALKALEKLDRNDGSASEKLRR